MSTDGAALMDAVEAFLGRFVAYPSKDARVAHVLWVGHAHLMDAWDSTPRIAFLSAEPSSGKSRALEVTEPLVPRPVHAVNTTPAYLFRKVADEAGPPTLLYDEIDTVFGPKAKDNEDVRGMLNAGHRKGATAGRCVVRGKVVETEELPAYCAVALAGLGNLPDTIMTRAVVVRMRRRRADERVEPWRTRRNAPEGEALRDRLAAWAASVRHRVGEPWPEMPDGVEDRAADVWEALLAVADLAGGNWPERARHSAVAVVADSWRGEGSLGVRLLADLRSAFGSERELLTVTLLERLTEDETAPWGNLRGEPLDARRLSGFLAPYDVRPVNLRTPDGKVRKGYRAADLADPWSRYLSSLSSDPPEDEREGGAALPETAATSATPATEVDPRASETSATPATRRPCWRCGEPLVRSSFWCEGHADDGDPNRHHHTLLRKELGAVEITEVKTDG